MTKLARIQALGLLTEDELRGSPRETREIVALLCGAAEKQKNSLFWNLASTADVTPGP